MSQLPAWRLVQIRAHARHGRRFAKAPWEPQAVLDLLEEVDALRAALDEVPGYAALLAYDAGAPDYGTKEPAS